MTLRWADASRTLAARASCPRPQQQLSARIVRVRAEFLARIIRRRPRAPPRPKKLAPHGPKLVAPPDSHRMVITCCCRCRCSCAADGPPWPSR